MEARLFSNIEKTYYVKFQKKNETLRDAINRIDNKLIDDNFKWVCDRDILASDVILKNNKVLEWKNRHRHAD